ncbi:MAG: SH3 domain-containing protein [Oscillospiraceae bacterium]|nr:SH3 domain-containing protein [Oscillospiraceae bacterium]
MTKKTQLIIIITCLILGITLSMPQSAVASGTFRTTDGVHLRSGPSTDASSIMVVSVNTAVDVTEHDPAGWSKVQVDGISGYIRSDFLKAPASDDSPAAFRTTAGVHLREEASTASASIMVVSINSTVDVLNHDPAGWSRVRVGDKHGHIRSDFLKSANASSLSSNSNAGSEASSGEIIATLKTIGEVNLRAGPSTTTNIIRKLPGDTSVEVYADENDWSKVKVSGTDGYIRSDLLAAAPTSSSASAEEQPIGIYKTVGTVNLRASASTSSSILSTLTKDTNVEVFANESDGWSRVRVSGVRGYIKTELLTEASSASSEGPIAVLKTVGTVNLRARASTSSSIIAELSKDTLVDVYAYEDDWSRVRVNGANGYIRSDLLASANASLTPAIATVEISGTINLRSGPSTSANLLRELKPGAVVEILENESNGWSKVRVSGVNGYIRSDLLGVSAMGPVELIDWSEAIKLVPMHTDVRVIDVRTGISFNIRAFSTSSHIDYEPSTREDTDTIYRIRNGVKSWAARPVWVIVGNRTFAASTHGMPHDVSTIRDNGMDGHLCLHFKGTTVSSKSYERDMQKAVQEAYDKRPR